MANLQTFPLDEIQPSVFRRADLNPLDPDRVDRLRESILLSSLWPSMLVRMDAFGHPELIDGNHRMNAAHRVGLHEATVTVVDYTDQQVLRLLAKKQIDEHSPYANPLKLVESVAGTILALSTDRIKPFRFRGGVPSDAVRYTPSFLPRTLAEAEEQAEPVRPWTIRSVAEFLDADYSAVRTAVEILELRELSVLPDVSISRIAAGGPGLRLSSLLATLRNSGIKPPTAQELFTHTNTN